MNDLFTTLLRLAKVQRQTCDRLALQNALNDHDESDFQPEDIIASVAEQLHLSASKVLSTSELDQASLPALMYHPKSAWNILVGKNALNVWIAHRYDGTDHKWVEEQYPDIEGAKVFTLNFAKPLDLKSSAVFNLVLNTVLGEKSRLKEVIVGGALINFFALATSLYSMQVYDRVIPTGASETLLALTVGVFIVIALELATKFFRSNINEKLGDNVDKHLAKIIYWRFLNVRLDQLPASVGSQAAQLKAYETIRGFLVNIPGQLLVDLPFILFFTLVMAMIAGSLALIPFGFAVVSILFGLSSMRKVEQLTRSASDASNLKTGLLVETVEGAESIKAGQAGWRMLTKWLSVSDQARSQDLEMRKVTEHSGYLIASFHQISYIAVIAAGALSVSDGSLTMGSLIACSILSSRVLNPSSKLPSMLVQWGHVKASIQGLERMWALEDDHYGIEEPILLEKISGRYEFSKVEMNYEDRLALKVDKLIINPGEKIGIIGPVGAGKSTLLKLVSGLYQPSQGLLTLDGIDISHISKPLLAEQIGYIQQDGRLFSGTLRENLILGLVDPGDEKILMAAKITGLHQALIAKHPMGLDCPIAEGGTGLSGGQKQLVNLTKVFLRDPAIWLLDEPTAAIDKTFEMRVMQALKLHIKKENTLILITHKPEMLALVDRVIVVVDQEIKMDGPRDKVMSQLQENSKTAPMSKEVES